MIIRNVNPSLKISSIVDRRSVNPEINFSQRVDTEVKYGFNAGSFNQGTGSIAIGQNAGFTKQGSNAIAIGQNAGQSSQGTGSIAIGYQAGFTGQASNSIILNASSSALNAANQGFFVKPIQIGSTGPNNILYYNISSGEITSSSTGANSSSSTTGELAIAGGAGIGGNLYIGGQGYKPTGGTWISSSDIRIKEDIVDADLSICNNNIKNLKLKYYKYKDQYIKPEQRRNDNHQLGFIAQEVKQILPKSVPIQQQTFKYKVDPEGRIDENGEEKEEVIEDFHYLDKDQILMSLYGAVQYLQWENETLKSQLNINETNNISILSKVQSLESELGEIKAQLEIN